MTKDQEAATKYAKRVFNSTGRTLVRTELIQVCDKCHQASCWQGEFMCDESQFAGTVHLTRAALRTLNTGEHESYWKTDDELARGKNGN